MRTKILFLSMVLSCLTYISCTKDSEQDTSNVSANDVAENQQVDDSFDDISAIADDQYEVTEGSTTGKENVAIYTTILPDCIHTSDLGSTDLVRVWTITFGTETTACKFRGHYLKGKIILTRTRGTTFPKTMTITYSNFSINDNKIEGTSTWTREMIGTLNVDLHPKTTFTMTNMKLTTSKGTYTRNGNRVREMTGGFSTRTSPTDDIFSTYGTFTTTYPNGNTYTSLIESSTPLVHKTACGLLQNPMPFPVSGILKISKNEHYATINYGAGDCDNLAMLSIDGGTATQITLGN
jgi:hypothetical protein